MNYSINDSIPADWSVKPSYWSAKSPKVDSKTIRLNLPFEEQVDVRLRDKHIFTNKPPSDSLLNKLSRALGWNSYVILKVQNQATSLSGFVKVDARDLSERLHIDREILKDYIQASPNLDLTGFVREVIAQQALAKVPAETVASKQIKELKPPLPPKPVIVSKPPLPPKPVPVAEPEKGHIEPLPPEEISAREEARSEAKQHIDRLIAQGIDPKTTSSVLTLLSADVDDWLESGAQSLPVLDSLLAQVQDMTELYMEPNNKSWTEPIRQGRLEALLNLNERLVIWREVRQAGEFVDERLISFDTVRVMAESTHRERAKVENTELLKTLLNTSEPEANLNPETGLFDLSAAGEANQKHFNNMVSILGTNADDWRIWLLDDAVKTAFLALKNFVASKTSDPLEIASPVAADQLAETLSTMWTNHKDSNARIAVPVVIHNSHWTLVFVDPKKKSIEWYNSMGGAIPEDVSRQLNTFKNEPANAQLGLGIVNKSISAPQQDGYQCGVWISLFLARRALEENFSYKDLETDTSGQIAAFRKLLHNEIMLPLLWTYAKEKLNTNFDALSLDSEDFLHWLGAPRQ